MRFNALSALGPCLGLCLGLCAGLGLADGAAAAPAGSSITAATQRTLAAGARHHSSPIKRYRRHRPS